MHDWLNQRARIYWCDQYALNEQPSAFSKYDPDRIVSDLLSTGADIVAVYAANQQGIAYYPSAIWPQHPNLHGRDYVADLTTRLQQAGKKVILYLNWLDTKHPDWWSHFLRQPAPPAPQDYPLVSWADSKRPNHSVRKLLKGDWSNPCRNSPYRRQIIDVTRELLERYHPDGIHLDMLFATDICICAYCRPTLEQICSTKDLTPETLAAHWPQVARWNSQSSASLMAEIAALARQHHAAYTPNLFAPPVRHGVEGNGQNWIPSLDAAVSECFEAFGGPCTDLNTTSLLLRWQHALKKPAWILRTSHPLYYAHWPLTDAQWQLSAAACKANGCKVFGPCGVGARPDTTYAPGMLESVKSAMDFFMQDADLDVSATSAARVALMFSWRTRDNCPPGPDGMRWSQELAGWSRLLIEEHIPFDIVIAEDTASAKDLSRYDLIILPALSHLGPACCQALTNYVSAGGHLLATASTSLSSDQAEPLPDFALADTLGIHLAGHSQGHFSIAHNSAEIGPATGHFHQVATSGEVLAWRCEVDPAGSVTGAIDPLPISQSPWPVLASHRFGQGQTLYSAFEIGRYFDSHGDQHIARLMAAMLGHLLPQPQLTTRAPRCVEVTLWQQPTPSPRLIIHLANRTVAYTLPTHTRQISEIIPVNDIELDLPLPPQFRSGIKVSARQTELSWTQGNDRLNIRLGKVNAYAAIIIESANPSQ